MVGFGVVVGLVIVVVGFLGVTLTLICTAATPGEVVVPSETVLTGRELDDVVLNRVTNFWTTGTTGAGGLLEELLESVLVNGTVAIGVELGDEIVGKELAGEEMELELELGLRLELELEGCILAGVIEV